MAFITVKLENLDNVIKGFDDLVRALEINLVEALRDSGSLIERQMKLEAPIDTGNLRSSITQEFDFGKLRVTVGPDLNKAYYAPFVEYGHHTKSGSFVPGQFYVRATKEQVEESIFKLFEEAVAKAAQKF